MTIISDCLHSVVNWKKRSVSTVFVNSTTRKCPNKIFKTFLLGKFFQFATGVNNTGVAP